MSDIIKLLPDHVANQIAAGEVVQRPASVVKELLENAIDAKSTSIELLVENAGSNLVQVLDNGLGMSVTDARLSFERHATSKIKTTEDIFNINTKGFRGEALASIAAVAQVELQTKQSTDDIGTKINIEGSKLISQDLIACSDGTSIAIKNLFFNVPARRSFLKSNNIEFRHILDEYQRVALGHEDIEFKLYHNDSLVYHNRRGSKLQRILQVFGKKQEDFLTPIKEETDVLKVAGFVGKPDISRKTKGMQFFFINNRFIKSSYLHKAVVQAFDKLLPPKHHPAYFLFLETSPSRIDINIHPTKTEIKFTDDSLVYSILNATVRRSLGKFQVMDTLDFDKPEFILNPIRQRDKGVKQPQIEVDKTFNPFQKSVSKDFSVEKTAIETLYSEQIEWQTENEQLELLQHTEKKEYTSFQWDNSYIVVQNKDDLYIVDQHRAHQTILYRKFISQIKNNAVSQQLLFPVEINIDNEDKAKLQTLEKNLLSIGFDFDYDDEKLEISATPTTIKPENVSSIFIELFDSTLDDKGKLTGEEKVAKVLAKTCAIKKNHYLNPEEIKSLLDLFFDLPQNLYSPYYKKNYTILTKEELQNKL